MVEIMMKSNWSHGFILPGLEERFKLDMRLLFHVVIPKCQVIMPPISGSCTVIKDDFGT